MTTKRYHRRPESPCSDLKSFEWEERLESTCSWIEKVVRGDKRLHVGAIWGPRGSGKTSFLYGLLKRLPERKIDGLVLPSRDPQAKESEPSIFQPELLDESHEGDHLFTHLLKFVEKTFRLDVSAALRFLTEHRHHSDFKEFAKETAASEEELKKELQNRLERRATFSEKMRGALAKIGKEEWYFLPIDDIDLAPHRGPELLSLLHLYLRDLPFIVVLSADRKQFVDATRVYLGQRGGRGENKHREVSLSHQVVAKQIPYEWFVPTPTKKELLDDLLSRRGEMEKEPALGPDLKGVISDAAELLRDGWKREIERERERAREREERARKREEASDSDEHSRDSEREREEATNLGTPWKRPEELLIPLLPRTWRALNRTFNRLATLAEECQDSKAKAKAKEKYATSFGIEKELVLPLLAAIVATDEKVLELGLWEAVDRDPDGVFSELSWSFDRESKAETHENPPFDRLKAPWLEGRAEFYARDALKALTKFWRIARSAQALRALNLLSVNGDAERDWRDFGGKSWSEAFDWRRFIRGDRATAEELRKLTQDSDVRQDIERIRTGTALFPRAPLSLLAWLGWYTRTRDLEIHNLFEGRHEGFRAESSEIKREIRELGILKRVELNLRGLAEGSEQLPDDALVVIDIRREVHLGAEMIPLYAENAAQIVPAHRFKLASSVGFRVIPENIVDLLGDILWLFRELGKTRGVKCFHVAFATSAPLAFFVGRELHAFRPVKLYEYDPSGPCYRYVTGLG